ncbi:MAG: hypothetical protein RLZZ458_1654, partial [Planctomycetota bacterium]
SPPAATPESALANGAVTPSANQPKTASQPASTATAAQSDQLPAVTLLDPLGQRSTLASRVQGRWLAAETSGTQRPGVYLMTLPDGRPAHFAVATSSAESDLTLLDSQQQQSIAQQLGAQLLTSIQAYIDADRKQRHGEEIWPWVLSGLLLLMCLEVVLQQRFAGVNR